MGFLSTLAGGLLPPSMQQQQQGGAPAPNGQPAQGPVQQPNVTQLFQQQNWGQRLKNFGQNYMRAKVGLRPQPSAQTPPFVGPTQPDYGGEGDNM